MKSMDVIRIFINRGKYFKLRSIALTHTYAKVPSSTPPTPTPNTVTKTDKNRFLTIRDLILVALI